MSIQTRLLAAAKVSAIHLAISAGLALCIAMLVFWIWFPYPYRSLAGGQHLFWVLVGVDVICGPLLTFVIFNAKKSRRELLADLTIIGFLQVAALIYGLTIIAHARPVKLVFETDRFVVVSAAEIDPDGLKGIPDPYQAMPWFGGPRLLGTRAPVNGDEALKSIELSIQGIEPSARPDWWQDFELSRELVQARQKGILGLMSKLDPGSKSELTSSVEKLKIPLEQVFYLPLVSKKSLDEWIVLLDKNSNILGFAPADGFL